MLMYSILTSAQVKQRWQHILHAYMALTPLASFIKHVSVLRIRTVVHCLQMWSSTAIPTPELICHIHSLPSPLIWTSLSPVCWPYSTYSHREGGRERETRQRKGDRRAFCLVWKWESWKGMQGCPVGTKVLYFYFLVNHFKLQSLYYCQYDTCD